jgi:virulence factor lipase-like protein
MTFGGRHLVLACAMFWVLLCSQPAFAGVQAKFSLDSPGGGPFPSDRFTIADRSQNTQRRVNLPTPDCVVRQSDCEDLAVINTLDGFHIEPRLSIPFDGSIDVRSVTSETVFLVGLDSRRPDCREDCGEDERDNDRRVIGINQVVWDALTNTLHVQADELLDQHTRYALIVTRGVRDESGNPVEASEAFRRFRDSVHDEYKHALLDAIHAAQRIGIQERDVVTASVFTTQTVTSILERIRDQIKAATPEPADFRLGPGGSPTIFALDTVSGITWDQQRGNDPPSFTRVTVDLPSLRIIPGAVGTIAFGKYTSPDYEVHPGEFIPPIGTRTGTPVVQGTNEIYFNLVLPSGPKPAGGWPVAIFGHARVGSKNGIASVAATMAAHGIATIAINIVGHGFGPLGVLTVNDTGGKSTSFSAGGRGMDQNNDRQIAADEGFGTAPPRTVIFFADGIRQTVVDLMQLVRVIEVGVDVDGDGSPDLDPSRIYYFGWSLGGNYGTVFLGVEPSVRAGALTVAGGPITENRRLSPADGRAILGQALASRIPSLINAPGITKRGDVSLPAPYFNENFPLRDGIPVRVQLADGTSQEVQSPVINTLAGATAVQEAVENMKWSGRFGDPVAYARYIRKTPLPGVPAKTVIYHIAKGDQSVPNPNGTAILRAGDLADRATFYRHDLAFAENPTLPKNPHTFIISTNVAAFKPIALGAQEQIAVFFATDGEIIHPEPSRFFEVPIAPPLPEDLNFIP